jgi:hypothetical protein
MCFEEAETISPKKIKFFDDDVTNQSDSQKSQSPSEKSQSPSLKKIPNLTK